jgi:hypothetical protein
MQHLEHVENLKSRIIWRITEGDLISSFLHVEFNILSKWHLNKRAERILTCITSNEFVLQDEQFHIQNTRGDIL